ncbi:hypothetical protein [Streptomyces sedi]|nr:hypothetical protein [Streptomyces sedi]
MVTAAAEVAEMVGVVGVAGVVEAAGNEAWTGPGSVRGVRGADR